MKHRVRFPNLTLRRHHFFLDEVEEKLHELESVGLSTQRDELEFAFLVRRTETINKCVEDLKEASQDHLACLRNYYDAE